MLNSRHIQGLLAALVALLAMSAQSGGCGGTPYPQYSGVYTLSGEPVFDLRAIQTGVLPADLRGEFTLPRRIRVTHRAEHAFSTFAHALRFEPLQESVNSALERPGARSAFFVGLADLTREPLQTIDHPSLNGAIVYQEPRVNSPVNPACSAQYTWSMYSNPETDLTPRLSTAMGIYAAHEVVQTAHGSVSVLLNPDRLRDPPQDAESSARWEQEIAAAGGAQIKLTLTLKAMGAVYGCKADDGDFPNIERTFGTVSAVYRAAPDALEQTSNPIVPDLTTVRGDADSGLRFWSEIVKAKR